MLLRDMGLHYRPESMKIHQQLAWIFQHKIGGITDDYHRYYKLQMAYELGPMLSSVYGDIIARCSFSDIEALAGAPVDARDLVSDPSVAELIGRIKQMIPDYQTDEDVFDGIIDFRINDSENLEAFLQLINENRTNPSFHKLDYFSRARALRKRWKMDPKKMHAINREYGPKDYNSGGQKSVDWRTPYSHALYWAKEGLRYRGKDERNFNTLSLERAVYHNLQNLYHFGNVQIYAIPAPSRLVTHCR